MITPYLLLIVNYVWDLFKLWINTIFVLPFKTTDMLWLLVPIWLGWFFSEFFQEKTGTSMGNAISNAVIVLWGSIDCTRQTVRLIGENALIGTWNIAFRFSIIALVFIYGLIILILGWKGNKLVKRIGRVREVTYVFVAFAPVFYNAVKLTWNHLIAAALFFPLFYFAIELIDRYTPNPKAVVQDMNEAGANKKTSYSQPSRPSMQQAQSMLRPKIPGQYPPQRPYSPPNPYNPYNRPPQNPPRY